MSKIKQEVLCPDFTDTTYANRTVNKTVKPEEEIGLYFGKIEVLTCLR